MGEKAPGFVAVHPQSHSRSAPPHYDTARCFQNDKAVLHPLAGGALRFCSSTKEQKQQLYAEGYG